MPSPPSWRRRCRQPRQLRRRRRADIRNYRVDFDKIARALPEFRPRWTVCAGIEEVATAYRRHGLGAGDFLGGRYSGIEHLRRLQAAGQIDETLRRRDCDARISA